MMYKIGDEVLFNWFGGFKKGIVIETNIYNGFHKFIKVRYNSIVYNRSIHYERYESELLLYTGILKDLYEDNIIL